MLIEDKCSYLENEIIALKRDIQMKGQIINDLMETINH